METRILTSFQLRWLVGEEGYITEPLESEDDWREDLIVEDWETINDEYLSSGRHQEFHKKVMRAPDGRYWVVPYSKSVKDSMGWEECNYNTEIFEIDPKDTISDTEIVDWLVIEYNLETAMRSICVMNDNVNNLRDYVKEQIIKERNEQ